MILKAIFKFFIGIAKWFLNLIPSFNFGIDLMKYARFIVDNPIFKFLWYFIPVDTFLAIVGIIIVIQGIKFTIALIVRIKSFIPTMPSN